VVVPHSRLRNMDEVMSLIRQFSLDYGKRFGQGSEAPEAGIRINTIRSLSHVQLESVQFEDMRPHATTRPAPAPDERRPCHFVGLAEPLETSFYELDKLEVGTEVSAPAVVSSAATTYLVEPGWRLVVGSHGAAWFFRAGEVGAASESKSRTRKRRTTSEPGVEHA
jgi:N-methylhydantoinase A